MYVCVYKGYILIFNACKALFLLCKTALKCANLHATYKFSPLQINSSSFLPSSPSLPLPPGYSSKQLTSDMLQHDLCAAGDAQVSRVGKGASPFA